MCIYRIGDPCDKGISTPVQDLPPDQARLQCIHTRRPSVPYQYIYVTDGVDRVYRVAALIRESPPYRVSTHTYHARELFAARKVADADPGPRATLQENPAPFGLPELPAGYVFSDWLRRATPVNLCMAVHPLESHMISFIVAIYVSCS